MWHTSMGGIAIMSWKMTTKTEGVPVDKVAQDPLWNPRIRAILKHTKRNGPHA
jgi:hypothetical protein